MSPQGLSVRALDAWYGQSQVLYGVGLEARRGEIVGVFGHNGAGKSTLLGVIAGLHPDARFQADLDGEALNGRRPHEIARTGLVLVREGARVFPSLEVQEHLKLGQRLARLGGREPGSIRRIYELFPILHEFRSRSAVNLSGGQRQMLALAMALAAGPRCLLLDEPSTGLSPQTLDIVSRALRDFATSGAPVLIAEQNPAWLSELAGRAYLLGLGRVEGEGPPSELLRAGARQ